MDCGRVQTAWAAAEPVRAPARHAGSLAKWAASHSSMQPESCRFNRGHPHLEIVTECGETVNFHVTGCAPPGQFYHLHRIARMWWPVRLTTVNPLIGGHTTQNHRRVCTSETERIRQYDINFAFA